MGDMVFDPETKCWLGNESELKNFDSDSDDETHKLVNRCVGMSVGMSVVSIATLISAAGVGVCNDKCSQQKRCVAAVQAKWHRHSKQRGCLPSKALPRRCRPP